MTFGGSQLIELLAVRAKTEGYRFRMIVVDSSPDFSAIPMMERLTQIGIKCKYCLISGVSYLISTTTKVFLEASSVLSNGAIQARVGTSLLACIASKHQVPVVVFSESYKFSDKVNLDPINNNEIRNPERILQNPHLMNKQNV